MFIDLGGNVEEFVVSTAMGLNEMCRSLSIIIVELTIPDKTSVCKQYLLNGNKHCCLLELT